MKTAEAAWNRLVRYYGRCGYNEEVKARFKRDAMAVGRALSGLLASQADVRWNPGGIAVSGEVTVHGDHVYVMISADVDVGALVRTCRGRKDYTGGRNQYCSYKRPWDWFVAFVRQVNEAGMAEERKRNESV